MESSLSSSQSETRMSKTLFKKPLTKANTSFEVSLNESSIVEPQNDKTDMDLDFTSMPKKTGPFKKNKKPIQQFNVTVEESLTESDHEKTVANQKLLFKHKNQPVVDFFNVSECESKLTVTQVDSLIESNTSTEKESMILHNKTNPFRKSKQMQKKKSTTENVQLQETTMEDESMSDSVNKSSNQTNMTVDNSDTNVSNLTNRKNLFKIKKKSRVSNVENLMEVTSTEDDGDKSFVTKTNIFKSNVFKKQNICDQMMEISSTDELTLVRSQQPNESPNPQETQSNSFIKNSSRLSAKEHSGLNTSNSHYQELENNEKSISFNTNNTETNKSSFSKNDQTSPSLTKTRNSKLRSSTNSINLSSENADPNITTSSVSGKKQSVLSNSKIENQEQKASNLTNSIISKKNKKSSLRESTKKSRTEKSLNMSIADVEGGTSKSSGTSNSFTDVTEKNRNLSTTETIKTNLCIDKNLSKTTNKSLASEVSFEQSSYNDDNLNDWMSDHSNQEIPQINIPPVSTEKEPPKDTVDKSQKHEETSVLVSWEEKFNEIVSNAKKSNMIQSDNKINLKIQKEATKPKVTPSCKKGIHKPPKLKKPAPFATKTLYQFLIKRLKPKYGIDCIIEAEQLVLAICDTVKKVIRRKDVQKGLIQDLKKQMAKAGIIETTLDFYEFVIRFLPYDFRVKVVPCFQPVTNTVYPPKDTRNPFEKIL